MFGAELENIRDAGLFKPERIITTPQRSAIGVSTKPGQTVLNFCANNYLGLSDNAEVGTLCCGSDIS